MTEVVRGPAERRRVGWVYRSASTYALLMRFLYRGDYRERYEVVASHIPEGSRVVDLCCGPPVLFERHLRKQRVAYTGVDLNPGFVAAVEAAGGKGVLAELPHVPEALPEADVVLMQASLYHFLPDGLAEVVALMKSCKPSRIIIAEPVHNTTSSGIPGLGKLSAWATDPGTGKSSQRFSRESLEQALFALLGTPESSGPVASGREWIYVFDASKP